MVDTGICIVSWLRYGVQLIERGPTRPSTQCDRRWQTEDLAPPPAAYALVWFDRHHRHHLYHQQHESAQLRRRWASFPHTCTTTRPATPARPPPRPAPPPLPSARSHRPSSGSPAQLLARRPSSRSPARPTSPCTLGGCPHYS